jgi:hypothetical protein
MEAKMADRPTSPGGLCPEVRDRLVRLLADELGTACDAAVAAGSDPRRVAELIDERRRSIEAGAAARDDGDR